MPDKPVTAISRREFARRAAVASAIGSAVASIAPASVVGAELGLHDAQAPSPGNPGPASGSAPASSPAQTPLALNLPRLSPEGQAEADARFQAILVQYGSRFSDEQKADLRRLCAVAQQQLDRLRAYPVQNGDGAALYLKPLFEREKKPKSPPRSTAATPAKP
jgi:hypothetical protein